MGGGLSVLGTAAYSLSARGNYYRLPELSWTDPALVELAVAATVLTGVGALVVGVLSLAGHHPVATLAGTTFPVVILVRPAYAQLPYGDLAFAVACVLGAACVSLGATFVVLVEGRLYLSRWRRSTRREEAAG